jgi:adenylate kinase
MADLKQVIIFIGPPGSGKDTQANLLVEEFGMTQMPSSRILRAKFAENPDDPVIAHERELFDTGKLNSPEFVANAMLEFVGDHAAKGESLIFSGSPRTVGEAEVEIPALAELYGMEHITVIYLNLLEEEAKRRIASRRFCRANGHPIPGTPEFSHLKTCPIDGSELYVRPLDDASLQDTRFHEYRTLTEPCLDIMRKQGLNIYELDGSKTIQAIHQEIIGILERHRTPVPKE